MLVAIQTEKKTRSLNCDIYMVCFEGCHPAFSSQAGELCHALAICATIEFASAMSGSCDTLPAAVVVARLYVCWAPADPQVNGSYHTYTSVLHCPGPTRYLQLAWTSAFSNSPCTCALSSKPLSKQPILDIMQCWASCVGLATTSFTSAGTAVFQMLISAAFSIYYYFSLTSFSLTPAQASSLLQLAVPQSYNTEQEVPFLWLSWRTLSRGGLKAAAAVLQQANIALCAQKWGASSDTSDCL